MKTRARAEGGFGLIELLIAMTILNVALLALVAAFNSGALSLQRAGKTATASALADSQMELYRALRYIDIRLDTSSVTAANGNAVYAGDTAWSASQVTASCSGVPNECNPMRNATGADSHRYRVDTYIVAVTPAGGRQVKRVTVVVRDADRLTGTPLARVQSTFDESTGR